MSAGAIIDHVTPPRAANTSAPALIEKIHTRILAMTENVLLKCERSTNPPPK
jgi:hypothetical protein